MTAWRRELPTVAEAQANTWWWHRDGDDKQPKVVCLGVVGPPPYAVLTDAGGYVNDFGGEWAPCTPPVAAAPTPPDDPTWFLRLEAEAAIKRLAAHCDALRAKAYAHDTEAASGRPIAVLLATPEFQSGACAIRFADADDGPTFIGTNPEWGAVWVIAEVYTRAGDEPSKWHPTLYELQMVGMLVPMSTVFPRPEPTPP